MGAAETHGIDILERVQADWNDLAELNAAWFNVPSEALGGRHWDMDAFFSSGREHLESDLAMLEGLGVSLSRGAALDFGCGLGRVTQALGGAFPEVYGVDISSTMIRLAQQFNRYGDRCRYLVNARPDLARFGPDSFDLVYAENVLQHVPPPIIGSYLTDFLRVLRPGGALVFQIPLRRLEPDTFVDQLRRLPRSHPRRVWNKARGILFGHSSSDRYYRLRRIGVPKRWLHERLGLWPHINMFCFDEPEIERLVERYGCTVRHVRRYPHDSLLHAKFVVLKPGKLP
jgi:SAM-dependent methyltransferase